VVSGVIQGSCSGQLLFVLYINDVVALFDQSCNCKLYADDLKLYMCIIVFVTSKNVSIDLLLGRISGNLTYRRKKCTILQVGNDSVDCTFHLGCEVITEVSVVKYLGISVDNLLNFNSHISQITARASARANLIHRCFVSKDISTMTRAFVVYVYPLLEYASCVWLPMPCRI